MVRFVDERALPPIELERHTDSMIRTFYTGMLQFPSSLEFRNGIKFVFHLSVGEEYMTISPMTDDDMRNAVHSRPEICNGLMGPTPLGRTAVGLCPRVIDGEKVYVAYVKGRIHLPLQDGIFFTVFTSRKGEEQFQMSALQHRKKKRTG